jgi:tetratricopeptide (TPR) repeat protein
MLLDEATIEQVAQALEKTTFTYDRGGRARLLIGIRQDFVRGLANYDTDTIQLRKDLDSLSQAISLADGSVPLIVWLENAVRTLKVFRQITVFEDALAESKRRVTIVLGPELPRFHEPRRYQPVFQIPRQESPWVGRETEIENVRQHLFRTDDRDKAGSRCFVISGLPGVGKTEFAKAIVRDDKVRSHFFDGVLWVSLGRKEGQENQEVSAALTNWCEALGMTREALERQNLEARKNALADALKDRTMLLVVEDVWDARIAQHFLLGGPHCVHLVTSRLFEVVRMLRALKNAVHIPLGEMSTDDALLLLKQYAPDVVDSHLSQAEQLATAAGKLPLALALMGIHLNTAVFPHDESSVQKAFQTMNDAKERLQIKHPVAEEVSVSAAIEISVEALKNEPRVVHDLYRLSVFPPKPHDFSEEAALQAVQAGSNTLHRLSDVGLVERSGTRYTLHQTITDYAMEKLKEAGGDEATKRSLVAYFVRFIENNQDNFKALDQERTNIFRVLEIAFEQQLTASLLRAVNALYRWMENKGLYDMAMAHLPRAEAAARSRNDQDGLATVLCHIGRFEEKLGNYQEASKHLDESLLLNEEAYRRKMCDLRLITAIVEYNRCQYKQADEHLQEGLQMAKELSDASLVCRILERLVLVQFCSGTLLQAQQYLDEGLGYASGLAGTDDVKMMLLLNRGRIELRHRLYEKAWQTAQEGLLLATRLESLEYAGALKQIQAKSALMQGKYQEAEQLLHESLLAAQQTSHCWYISLFQFEIGDLYLKWDRHREADEAFEKALMHGQELQCPDLIAYALFGHARLSRAKSNFDQAISQAEESFRLLNEIGHYKAENLRQLLDDLLFQRS